MGNRPIHQGSFERWARVVRSAADADPTTRCWRISCGLTKAQHGRDWTAGHLHGETPGPWARVFTTDEGDAIAAECARCNYSDGATRVNARKRRRVSRNWFA